MTTRMTVFLALVCLLHSGTACSLEGWQGGSAARVSLNARSGAAEADAVDEAGVRAAMAELPICFEQNVGQSDSQVAFLARGSGYGLFLTPDEMVLSLQRAAAPSEAEPAREASKRGLLDERIERAPERLETSVLRMRLEGAHAPAPVGEQQLETKTNYFIGNDPERWHTDVPNFARVRYPGVYPGVDLVYYSRGGQLEYDFEVAPGADPNAIAMWWEGAESIDVDETGALVLKVAGGEVRQSAPVLYQETEGGRTEIAGQFAATRGGRVGVIVGPYDETRPLVIDPVLVYSTYLGGNGAEWNGAIAVDSSGAAYITDMTRRSDDFPTTVGAYDTDAGFDDVFVTKLSPAGDALVYSTFIGGSHTEQSFAIAVDSSGAAYITGYTGSDDFPIVGAFDPTLDGSYADAFVAKLSAAGNTLNASTYFGGSSEDIAFDIAVARASVYITGYTLSSDMPVKNAFDSTANSSHDAFVAKLTIKPAGIFLAYSTFLGGDDWDSAYAVAVDASGAAYVAGTTYSSDFPTAGAFDATLNGDRDAFVTKLSAAGDALVYSTYLGGDWNDHGTGIAIDASGAAYVTGYTYSSNFPVTRAFDWTHNGGSDAFVTKLSATGNALVYSMYLGGDQDESGIDIAVDASGAAYVTGSTHSSNFPVKDAVDSTANGLRDAFVAKLSATGRELVYSTYLGGDQIDYGRDIAIDASGAAYVVGITESSNFPIKEGFDPSYGGGKDLFVAKLQ